MPSKQTPIDPASAAADPAAKMESPATQPTPMPIAPATKRFKIAMLLFGAWLVFLTYLAFLTWSGK